jgi:hypothetical protein
MTESNTGVKHLQAKEHQELLGTIRSLNVKCGTLSSEPPEETNTHLAP